MFGDVKEIENGLIIPVYKPLFWSSFDVVKTIRFFFKKKYGLRKIKVGHAGTLDPLATGLLLVCTEKKTKQIEKLQALKKTYYTTFHFGATTPSFDLETDIDKVYDINHITNNQIKQTIEKFNGELLAFLQNFDNSPTSIQQVVVQSASEVIANKLSQEIPLDELAKL